MHRFKNVHWWIKRQQADHVTRDGTEAKSSSPSSSLIGCSAVVARLGRSESCYGNIALSCNMAGTPSSTVKRAKWINSASKPYFNKLLQQKIFIIYCLTCRAIHSSNMFVFELQSFEDIGTMLSNLLMTSAERHCRGVFLKRYFWCSEHRNKVPSSSIISQRRQTSPHLISPKFNENATVFLGEGI